MTSAESYWRPLFELWKQKRKDIVSSLGQFLKNKADLPDRVLYFLGKETVSEQDKQQYSKVLQEAFDFYSSEFSLQDFVERLGSQQLGTVIGLDGFIPYVASRPSLTAFGDESLASLPRRVFRFGVRTTDVGRVAVAAGSAIDEDISRLFPMGPSRQAPQRWYIFTGTSPQDVGYRGDSMPDYLFRNPDVSEEVNAWLERLEIGYRFQTRPVGERTRDLFEVRLTDTRRKGRVEVGLPDVGFGVSQLLPFIVQALASEGQIISIEQPEVHVHPRLQADIGDLLAQCVGEPRHNQFLVETHSEHLVLRLQRLVREGRLDPDKVSIIYVSRRGDGATVTRLRLDQEGDFSDEWPGGFFPERLRELK